MVMILLLVGVSVYLPCRARAGDKDRAKIVEEYVISAKFDEKSFPQLNDKSHTKNRLEAKEGSLLVSSSRGGVRDEGHQLEDFDTKDDLQERDFLVHHHHLPPVPHPPPPPPPVGLAYAPSLFAVGLIVFLILLNSLQTSFLLLKSKGSLLGSVTGALGRRKRFALEERETFENFLENFNNATT